MKPRQKPSPYAAAGTYSGFTLQDVRLTFHLLTSPAGCLVSIEHKDDVAVHHQDGTVVHEQVKSAPRSDPLRDTAPEFWKTLANWGKAVETVIKSTTDRFQLYVTPPRTGEIAMLVHSATTDADADAVINAAASLLKSAGKTLKPQLERFLDLPTEVKRYVIRHTEIINNDNDEYAPIYSHMGLGVSLKYPVVAQALRYVIGAAQTEARALMRAGQPAMLSADKFKNELQGFIQRTNMQHLLPSADPPDAQSVEHNLSSRPTFVRQLELINLSRDEQIAAVADFLRASTTKSIWAEDGLVLASSLERWDSALTSAHASYCLRVKVEHAGKPPEDRGLAVLSHCYLHKEKLDANDVGSEFIRGSFHGLSDRKVLGWHDDYKLHLDNDE